MKVLSLERGIRRRTFATVVLGTLTGSPFRGYAADYPTRPVTIVAAFSPGGPNDIVARFIAESLKDVLKQPVLVENVTGAGGIVGTRRVLSAPADGYQLLAGAAYLVTAPHLFKTANFDPAKDLVPVSPPVESLLVFVSGRHSDLKVLLANARQTNTPIRVATPGAGTLSHLGSAMLGLVSGAPMVQVHYRGVAPAANDLMGGHVDLLLDGLSSSLPLIRDGRLKGLAVPDESRNPLVPEVPTMGQLGFPSVRVRAWNAIFANAATAKPITDLLSTEIARIVARPDIAADFSKRGLEPAPMPVALFRQRIAAESARWKQVITDARITVE